MASSWKYVENVRKGSGAHKLRTLPAGAEWWEARQDTGPKPTARERALYIDAKRAGVLIEVTRHRALSMISDDVTHLIRVRKICDIMEA
jgi:hypothetical protein